LLNASRPSVARKVPEMVRVRKNSTVLTVPIVTSNLMVQGSHPRYTIGTVNTVEFFLTLTISGTFLATLGLEAFSKTIIGLLIGGVIAAPLGAVVAKRVEADKLLVLVGLVLTATSGWGLWRLLTA
jgi:uncharacterized protein